MKSKNVIFLLICVMMTVGIYACSDQTETVQIQPTTSALTEKAANPETSSNETKIEYIKITAEEAKNKMDENKDAIILDVRTESEYMEKHIGGAILIPNETIQDTIPVELPDLDAEILVYCRSGNRSEQASKKLIALGYTNVFDFGGINDWPYDTVAGNA